MGKGTKIKLIKKKKKLGCLPLIMGIVIIIIVIITFIVR